MDQKDFFLKPIKKKRRINLNDLLPIQDGAIFCEHGNNQSIGYRLEDLCTYNSFQKCNVTLIDDTILTIEIDQWYAIKTYTTTYHNLSIRTRNFNSSLFQIEATYFTQKSLF